MNPLSAFLTIASLIFLSGIFSLFDYSFASCQITRLEKEISRFYRRVLKERQNPVKLQLSCRIWINMLRITASFITGAAVIRHVTETDASKTVVILAAAGSVLAVGVFTVLIGDWLPKLLSRIAPEKTTAFLFLPAKFFYYPLIPFITPVMRFGDFFHTALNIDERENNITEDDLRNVLKKGEESGIVESSERTMVEGVFYLGDRAVSAFMTHRSDIQWLDIKSNYDELRGKALEHRQQRCFPVVDGGPDEIIGAVYLEDIIIDTSLANPQGLRAIMKKAQFIPETMSALKAFESFKQGEANFLFVMDEYGGLAGVISIRALIEEIIGELSSAEKKETSLLKLEDGSFLADGALNIDEAAKTLSLVGIEEDGDYHTLAGFVLFLAGELPGRGDSYSYQGYRFTVKEMTGNRIDKILITRGSGIGE